jgi:hypothetical protein
MARPRRPYQRATMWTGAVIAIADATRETTAAAIRSLQELSVRPVMLSGDSCAAAQRTMQEPRGSRSRASRTPAPRCWRLSPSQGPWNCSSTGLRCGSSAPPGALQFNPRRNIAERFVPESRRKTRSPRGVVTDGDCVRVLTVDGMVRQLDARTAVARQLDLLEQHEPGAVLAY